MPIRIRNCQKRKRTQSRDCIYIYIYFQGEATIVNLPDSNIPIITDSNKQVIFKLS